MKKLASIRKDRLYDVTMFNRRRIPFNVKNSNATALTKAVSEPYLDVYNFFIVDKEDFD